MLMSNKMYMNDIFDNFMFPGVKVSNYNNMKCDIYEKDNIYYLEMDIVGFDKNEVNIELNDNNYLIVTAIKSNENIDGDENRNYICKERNYSKYQRAFYIGDIDKDNIIANFSNGILKITMPKRLEEKSKIQKIEIK